MFGRQVERMWTLQKHLNTSGLLLQFQEHSQHRLQVSQQSPNNTSQFLDELLILIHLTSYENAS